jgi:hypothetical protein
MAATENFDAWRGGAPLVSLAPAGESFDVWRGGVPLIVLSLAAPGVTAAGPIMPMHWVGGL